VNNVLSTRIWPIGALLGCTPMHLNDGKGTSVLCDWLPVSQRSRRTATDYANAVRRRSSANVQSIYQLYQPLPQIFSPRLQMSVKRENHSLNDSLMFRHLRNKDLDEIIRKSLV
jgi:hypothetical protein